MRLSTAGRTFLESQEGCCLEAYWDRDGWSIGFGHHGRGVYQGMQITRDQADVFFEADIAWVEVAVSKLVTADIDHNSFDALCSFTYNEGAGGLAGSTLLKDINLGITDPGTITDDFAMYNKARGPNGALVVDSTLVARRAAEAKLYLTPDL